MSLAKSIIILISNKSLADLHPKESANNETKLLNYFYVSNSSSRDILWYTLYEKTLHALSVKVL